MRQLEFMGRMLELVAEWQGEYKMHRNISDEPENWPDIRDRRTGLVIFLWLQCKGYTL